MRLILDTNVVVSANIQKSFPYLIVDHIFAHPENFQVCISEPLFVEYVEVLGRKKFDRFSDFQARAQTMLTDIEKIALKFNPTIRVDLLVDEPDNRLLELAETCGADYLITGNINDFVMADYKGTVIISPKDFFERINT